MQEPIRRETWSLKTRIESANAGSIPFRFHPPRTISLRTGDGHTTGKIRTCTVREERGGVFAAAFVMRTHDGLADGLSDAQRSIQGRIADFPRTIDGLYADLRRTRRRHFTRRVEDNAPSHGRMRHGLPTDISRAGFRLITDFTRACDGLLTDGRRTAGAGRRPRTFDGRRVA